MVIVRLTGGLGNQLFQYAAALRLAAATGSPLKLDISSFRRDPKRAYALAPFTVSATIADRSEIAMFQGRERVRLAKWRAYESLPVKLRRWHWIKQRSLYFSSEVLQVKGNVYLDGNWQSEAYFNDIAKQVRGEFTLREPASETNERMARAITSNSSAVSLHIRRGDYVADKATRSIHEVCSLGYYRKALQHVAEAISRPHIFVFSDDPAWARENLLLPFPTTVIGHNPPEQGHEDLRLMSLCRHHIIANSSFSWWGAWLCRYPNKIVYAPGKWYNLTYYNVTDIVPREWRLVDL